ncbi:hypothetical protein ACN6MY_04715 [Peribacillus sp. B-H-3]|uniref:hypothetical protein n=1 Tax=Peribacillus sp. B-H-3 TaxID=3400420 RepID=UPI003B02E5EC
MIIIKIPSKKMNIYQRGTCLPLLEVNLTNLIFTAIIPRIKIKLNTSHQSTGWFGLLFGMVHGLVLIFDNTESLSLLEVFVPFASSSHRVSMGIGILALYSLLLLILTSDMMKVV